jgi:transcriptional regulator with XRE-family HTH domain
MSSQFSGSVALYVQRLKSHFAVRTDEELAAELGISKQAIANWRRRGAVPLKVQQDFHDRYGIRYQAFDLEMDEAEGDIVYAVSLYAYEKLRSRYPDELAPGQQRLLSRAFIRIKEVVRDRVKRNLPAFSHPEVLIRLLNEEVAHGRFDELTAVIEDLDLTG